LKETANEHLDAIVERLDAMHHDMTFAAVRQWKDAEEGRHVIGYLPVYAPIEMITAAGMLPFGVVGGGDQLEIIRGDAYFQSYICHLPRSVVELGVSGRLDFCEGFIFPSTCDVIRNLSGIWQVNFPDLWVHYFDIPQDFSPQVGGQWLQREMRTIRAALEKIAGREITDEAIWTAIHLHEENRSLLRELYDLRSETPWKVPTTEVYLVQKAGMLLPVAEHNQVIRDYMAAAIASDRPLRDHSRVVLSGTFCEQPPLGLLATLERAGCYIVDDDLLLGPRFFRGQLDPDAARAQDPIEELARVFLADRHDAAFVYTGDTEKGASLAEVVKQRSAEGVIFCAPSFCDPALLDRPMLIKALEARGVSHISFKYSENTGQFQTIREQAGTFADSLKLWSEA
jgi:benzoyl-CoA reductase subunit C